MRHEKVIYTCLCCKKEFLVPHYRVKNNPKYCSTECKYQDKYRRVEQTCKQCGKTFSARLNRVKKGWDIFCSEECMRLSRRKRILVTCVVCGKPIEVLENQSRKVKSHFCSFKCRMGYKPTGVTFSCVVCGKEKTIKLSEYNRAEVHACSKKCLGINKRSSDFDPNSRSSNNYNIWKSMVKVRDKYKCQKCGAGKNDAILHAHHILSWKDFPNERFKVENGITLCFECHIKEHSNNQMIMVKE